MENISTDQDSEKKAIDVLYRISTLAGKEKNPLLALEGILEEVMDVFSASSASISLLKILSFPIISTKLSGLTFLLLFKKLSTLVLEKNSFIIRFLIPILKSLNLLGTTPEPYKNGTFSNNI